MTIRGQWRSLVLLASLLGITPPAQAQERAPARLETPRALTAPSCPAAADQPLPINLPTALQLAGARSLDIRLAAERIRVAAARLERAQVMWLPTLAFGIDYFRHDGQVQDVAGNVFATSKSSFMAGAGPVAVFSFSEALFEPLAARQVVRAREAALQAATNDGLLEMAEAYFDIQQARGDVAGAEDTAARSNDLLGRAEQLAAGGIIADVEVVRIRAEAARRRQAIVSARERWQTAGAELARMLRLDPAVIVQPLEPPALQITLVGLEPPVDALIPVALTNRPELAAQQALVQATLGRLRQERLRPLVPSVLLRGASTNPAGTLGAGVFGGGRNGTVDNWGARSDFDIQALWRLENFGLGNRASVREREAERDLSLIELMRTQDRVAADVVRAYAQARSAALRAADAEAGLRAAAESVRRNFDGLGQTRRLGGGAILPIIRTQEAVASVQALALAYTDYDAATSDYNRAQFRLYRALGRPAQALATQDLGCSSTPGQHARDGGFLPPSRLILPASATDQGVASTKNHRILGLRPADR